MKITSNNKGMSVIVIVLVLAVGLLVLFMSVGHDFNSLNKATVDLKEYSNEVGVSHDIGQMLMSAYQKAKAAGGSPPACGYNSASYHPEGSVTFYLCIPASVTGNKFCSTSNAKYCVASPPQLAIYKGSKPDYIVKVNPDSSYLQSYAKSVGRIFLGNQALATEVWLPAIPAVPPVSLTIAVPNCQIAGNQDCVRCGVNADCLKIKICNNNSSVCPDGGGEYIEPVFAFQYTY